MTDQKINADITKLAGKIKKQLTVDESGIVTAKDSLVEKTLPKDLTAEQLERAQTHMKDITTATTLAVGELGVEAFKGNKDLKQVRADIDYGNFSLSVSQDRSKDVKKGDDTEVTWGAIRTGGMKIEDTDSRNSMRAVRDHISALAAEALADDE